MGLFGLPAELSDEILLQAFKARGLKRGMRLRLVNKTFERCIMQVIYTNRLLDRLHDRPRFLTRFYSPLVMASYLRYRVTHEPSHGNPILNCFWRLATEIQIERTSNSLENASFDTCLEQLCSVSMMHSDNKCDRYQQIFEHGEQISEKEYEAHLFAAALCTNTHSIVRRCADKDPGLLSQMDTMTRSDLFSPHLDLAAQYGDQELLTSFMITNSGVLNRKTRTALLIRTAQAGRLELLNFVHNFQRTQHPWEFGQRESEDQYEAGALYFALDTTDLETLKYVDNLRKLYPTWPNSRLDITGRMATCAQWGRADSTAYLLEQGADAEGVHNMHAPYITNHPVVDTCKSPKGNIAVVDLLIRHGADPKVTIAAAASRGRTSLVRELLDRGIKPIQALGGAAKGPYLDVVRLLLDAGVDVNESSDKKVGSPLVNAISLEHTELFRLLMERGANLTAPGISEECVKVAKQDGLESMLDLLKEYGVEVTSVSENEDL